eukprot:TRINITY_DN3536_c0_g2_i7.p1 TRINITY_DN3536_c0_g2~~TRINITY_DN3536_c0_g2_i7.p1  ORF type:complete len:145 (+),score=24.03 TRINITY_DN3536_c0_g2_i7:253-687(+)
MLMEFEVTVNLRRLKFFSRGKKKSLGDALFSKDLPMELDLRLSLVREEFLGRDVRILAAPCNSRLLQDRLREVRVELRLRRWYTDLAPFVPTVFPPTFNSLNVVLNNKEFNTFCAPSNFRSFRYKLSDVKVVLHLNTCANATAP